MRRVIVPTVKPGKITLDPDQAHHLIDVLRLKSGDEVEIFDPQGQAGVARIAHVSGKSVTVEVHEIEKMSESALRLTVASAIPKSARADWMIEKLSEIGVEVFIPLLTERSVVKASGKQNNLRWQRLAEESAKQSRRSGVMRIEAPVKISDVPFTGSAVYLSLSQGAKGMTELVNQKTRNLTLFVGPEGGWTEAEENQLASRGAQPGKLTATVLRVETAAVVAAGLAMSVVSGNAEA